MEEGHQNDKDRNQLERSGRRQGGGKIIVFSGIVLKAEAIWREEDIFITIFTVGVEILIRDVCRILNHYPIIMITFAPCTQFNIYLQYT